MLHTKSRVRVRSIPQHIGHGLLPGAGRAEVQVGAQAGVVVAPGLGVETHGLAYVQTTTDHIFQAMRGQLPD